MLRDQLGARIVINDPGNVEPHVLLKRSDGQRQRIRVETIALNGAMTIR